MTRYAFTTAEYKVLEALCRSNIFLAAPGVTLTHVPAGTLTPCTECGEPVAGGQPLYDGNCQPCAVFSRLAIDSPLPPERRAQSRRGADA